MTNAATLRDALDAVLDGIRAAAKQAGYIGERELLVPGKLTILIDFGHAGWEAVSDDVFSLLRDNVRLRVDIAQHFGSLALIGKAIDRKNDVEVAAVSGSGRHALISALPGMTEQLHERLTDLANPTEVLERVKAERDRQAALAQRARVGPRSGAAHGSARRATVLRSAPSRTSRARVEISSSHIASRCSRRTGIVAPG